MELLRLQDAARQLGVSYPTLKQWIYHKKLRSVRTPGGHHRIPRLEIERLMFQEGPRPEVAARGTPSRLAVRKSPPATQVAGLEHVISGRNQLVGRIVGLQVVGLLAKVTLDVGGQKITSIITRDASRDLGLKVGQTAAALIKATEVMIIRPTGGRG
jgi:molybdopterin-binding protein